MKLKFKTLIVIGILLVIFYVVGQTMAVINYKFAVSIGLQESSDDLTDVGVAFNKGFGLADTVFYTPLFIIGLIGILKRRPYGLYSMIGAMAITVYWPIVCLSALFYAIGSPGFNFTDHTSYSIILSFISLYGLWGFLFLVKNRNQLIN